MKVRLLRLAVWAVYLVMCLAMLGLGQFAADGARPWLRRTVAPWFEEEKPYCSPERTVRIEGCPDIVAIDLPVTSKSPYSDFLDEIAFEEQAKRLLADKNAIQREERRLEAEVAEREISEIAKEVAPQLNLTEHAARHVVRLARNERQRLEKLATERALRQGTEFKAAYLSLLDERRVEGAGKALIDSSGSQAVGAQLRQLESEFVDRLLADRLLPEFVRFGGSAIQASQINR